MAGRWTLCPEHLGSLIRNRSLSGEAALSKNLHEQGSEKETEAYIIPTNSPRQWLCQWIGERLQLCSLRLETLSFQNTGTLERSWNMYCYCFWEQKQASSCTYINICNKGGLCTSYWTRLSLSASLSVTRTHAHTHAHAQRTLSHCSKSRDSDLPLLKCKCWHWGGAREWEFPFILFF